MVSSTEILTCETRMQEEPHAAKPLYEVRIYDNAAELAPAVTKTKQYTTVTESDQPPRKSDKNTGFSLPLDYEIVFNKIVALSNDTGETTEAACFELKKTGETINTFYISLDYLENKRVLFEEAGRFIAEHEDPAAVEWMRKRVCPVSPADLPAWERTEPMREINPDTTADGMRNMEMSLSDDGNTRRFIEITNGDIIFEMVGERDGKVITKPRVWTGNYWKEGDKETAAAARNTMNTIGDYELPAWETELQKAELRADPEEAAHRKTLKSLIDKIRNHARKSRNKAPQEQMLKMAAESALRVDLMEIADFSIIAFKNGAYHTDLGLFVEMYNCEYLKEKYPVVHIPHNYTMGEKPVKFIQHLYTVFDDNITPGLTKDERIRRAAEMANYFMCLLGYMMIAGNPEQIFVFLYGDGANGKSATIDILDAVLSAERADAPIKELYADSDEKKPEIAKGLIRRLLTISEASPGTGKEKISLSLMKLITGEKSTTSFRRMYREARKTPINCLPVGVTNDKPRFDGELDYAALRRLVLIKFPHRFSPDERDPQLIKDIIENETDAILSFIIDKTTQYLKHGLPEMPAMCQDASKEFLVGEPYAEFVTSQYEKVTGKGEEDRISKNATATHYIEWCEEHGHTVETARKYLRDGTERITPTKTELNKLTNAFRVYGFEEIIVKGNWYYRCKRRMQ